MSAFFYFLNKIRKYEQAIAVLSCLVILYLYLLNNGYRIRQLSDKKQKVYIRSVPYQCAKKKIHFSSSNTLLSTTSTSTAPSHHLPPLQQQQTSLRSSSVASSSSVSTVWSPTTTSSEDLHLIPNVRFKLYIIAHDEKSQSIAERWSQCAPWTEIVRIPSTVFFESIIYQDLIFQLAQQENKWQAYDYIGIATYKTLKMTSMEKLKAYLELAAARSYDIVPLMTTGEDLLLQAIRGHGYEFQKRWEQLLLTMNYTENDIERISHQEVFLRNTYLIKPIWLLRLSQFMKYAIETYQQHQHLQQLFQQNAHYREFKLPVAQKIFHHNYYEWHPFIFERLPCFFFHYYNASIFTTLREVILFDNEEVDGLFKGY